MVQSSTSHITPFQRDKLFLDIYDACRHRSNAISDATALTDTVLSKLLALRASQGLIQRDTLVKITDSVLKQFDRSAPRALPGFPPSIKQRLRKSIRWTCRIYRQQP